MPTLQSTERALRTPYAQAAIPARYVIEREAWTEAAQLQPVASRFPFIAALTHFARALGAARGGQPAAGEADLKELTRIGEQLKATRDTYWRSRWRCSGWRPQVGWRMQAVPPKRVCG
jgi:hypothetical protein